MANDVIAIDPGLSGGIAWECDGVVDALPMPQGMTAICDTLRTLAATMRNPVAVVERVGGYMPGNSGPAAATFARHCGQLDAAVYLCGIPLAHNPTPQQWQSGLRTWPKDKGERKRAIKEWAAQRYPHLKVTLKTADALAMLAWAQIKG
jgi:hypothetical protein